MVLPYLFAIYFTIFVLKKRIIFSSGMICMHIWFIDMQIFRTLIINKFFRDVSSWQQIGASLFYWYANKRRWDPWQICVQSQSECLSVYCLFYTLFTMTVFILRNFFFHFFLVCRKNKARNCFRILLVLSLWKYDISTRK